MKPLLLLAFLLSITACITGPPPDQRDPTWTPTITEIAAGTEIASPAPLTATPGGSTRPPQVATADRTLTLAVDPPLDPAPTRFPDPAPTDTPAPATVIPTLPALPALPTPTRIVIPRPTGPAVLCVEVVPDDTLTSIARTYDVQPGIIVDWNKRKFPSLITNPDLLEIGWVLCMPVAFDTNTPSPKTTP